MNELNNLKRLTVFATEEEYADLDALRCYHGYAKKSEFYKVLLQEGFRLFTEGKYTLGNMLIEKEKEELSFLSDTQV